MGKIFKAVTSIFGGGSAPKVSDSAAQDVKADQNSTATDAKQARAAIYGTEGGPLGAVLDPNAVSKRQTIFGN